MIILLIKRLLALAATITFSSSLWAQSGFEEIVNRTNTASFEQAQDTIKKQLVGAWQYNFRDTVDFLNTDYLVAGKALFRSQGRPGKSFPLHNIVKWDLEIFGLLPVNQKSVDEVEAYLSKVRAEMKAEADQLKELKKEVKKAKGSTQKKLRKQLLERSVRQNQRDRSVKSSEAIKQLLEIAKKEGITSFYTAIIAGKSGLRLREDRRKGGLKNPDALAKEVPVQEPFFVFDGGFFTFNKGEQRKPRFKKFVPANARSSSSRKTKIDKARTHWEQRCSLIKSNQKLPKAVEAHRDCLASLSQLRPAEEIKPGEKLTVPGASDGGGGVISSKPSKVVPSEGASEQAQVQPQPQPQPQPKATLLEKPDYAHIRVEPVDQKMKIDEAFKALWKKGFYIHLREDGLFGFNNASPGPYHFVPTNRWTMKDQALTLILDKSSYSLQVPKEGLAPESVLQAKNNENQLFQLTFVAKKKSQR